VQGNPVGGSGSIVKTVYTQSDTFATMTGAFPVDDTIPQVSEGTQILSATIAPSVAGNLIRVRLSLYGSVNSAVTITVAVFISGFGPDAQHAFGTTVPTANHTVNMNCEYTQLTSSTSPLTFTVRIGPSSGTLSLNGLNGTRRYGGKAKCSLVLEEIRA